MNIIIVDDEPLVRIGIKSCIEWDKYDMSIIGEASDGVEALQLIQLLRPDVVLLDIKMPNMDGIELLNRIKTEGIICRIIILSSFDDFYHVKEAMKLGAVDYLHKPCMNPVDVLNSLFNIKFQIEKDMESTDKKPLESQNNTKIEKEVMIKDLLDGKIPYTNEIGQRLKKLNIRFENSNISCLAFCIKNLKEVEKRYKDSDLDILQASVSNIMLEVLSKEDMLEFIKYNKSTYAIVTSAEGIVSEKRILDNLNSIIYLTIDALREFLNVEIIIGVSNIHSTCKDLNRAFTEAIKALELKFFSNENQTIRYSDIKQKMEKNDLNYVDCLIGKMKINLAKQDYKEFEETLSSLITFLKREVCLSEEEIKKLSNGLIFIMKEGKECFEDMELINKSENLEELREIWQGIIEDKLSISQGINEFKSYSYIVKKIIKFLDENYITDITLNMLSDIFKVSPNYISRLFREETNINLFNYLNTVRIEKAKKLLTDPELKIYEVGFKVGFKSTVHFNIVFNKILGISPKQFRDIL